MILAGLGLAAVGFGARYALRQMPNAAKTFNEAMKNLPKFEESAANSKYYKGGFDQKMNRREAALILGKLHKQETIQDNLYRPHLRTTSIFRPWKLVSSPLLSGG